MPEKGAINMSNEDRVTLKIKFIAKEKNSKK